MSRKYARPASVLFADRFVFVAVVIVRAIRAVAAQKAHHFVLVQADGAKILLIILIILVIQTGFTS